MGKGFGAVSNASKDIERRKNSSGGDFVRKLWLNIEDGKTAIVRFLEDGDEVTSYWAHKINDAKGFRFIPCRDQDPETGNSIGEACPGCESTNKDERKKTFRGVLNLIWRDAPIYDVDGDGRINKKVIVGNQDQVAVWGTGITVFEDLQITEEDYGSLVARDFKIRRRGTGLDTKYSISPSGDPTPLSEDDQVLAENKYDLNEMSVPPSYETWNKNPQTKEEVFGNDTSVFLKRR